MNIVFLVLFLAEKIRRAYTFEASDDDNDDGDSQGCLTGNNLDEQGEVQSGKLSHLELPLNILFYKLSQCKGASPHVIFQCLRRK